MIKKAPDRFPRGNQPGILLTENTVDCFLSIRLEVYGNIRHDPGNRSQPQVIMPGNRHVVLPADLCG
jgi:hypothetical protein